MKHQLLFSRLRRGSLLRITLLNVGLLDELISGFPVVGLPLLRDQLGLSYEQVGLLFSVPALSSMILEPLIKLLSDRGSKRWWILGGFLILAVAFALAASVRNFGLLLVAFALFYPANGAAVGLSQAALIDHAPHDGARTMTRWTLLSSVGDLLSPLVVAAFVALGLGWSALCWLAVGLWLAAALFVWPQHFPRPIHPTDEKDGAEISILTGLRKALRDPILLRWAALAIIPTMLDEIFIGFAALYLRDVLHASEIVIGLVITIQLIGTFLGLIVVDRLVGRFSSIRLLTWLAILTLVGLLGFLTIHSLWFAAFTLFIIDFGAAGLYPIAQAEAYARQPGRSGTVLAVIGLGQPFEVALPGIVGLVAGRFGVLAGIGLLGLAPLLVLLLLPRRVK